MPKVTYPRPCPTCGKELSKRNFFHHKKQCGTTENRYHCPFCPLSFSHPANKQRHMRQHHSKNPHWFTCPECHHKFKSKQGIKIHLETVCSEVKSYYKCWHCNASFTRQNNRQMHMRKVHARICREHDINLFLHLQHLSEEENFQGE